MTAPTHHLMYRPVLVRYETELCCQTSAGTSMQAGSNSRGRTLGRVLGVEITSMILRWRRCGVWGGGWGGVFVMMQLMRRWHRRNGVAGGGGGRGGRGRGGGGGDAGERRGGGPWSGLQVEYDCHAKEQRRRS